MTGAEPEDERVTLDYIRIERTLDDGGPGISVAWGDGLHMAEALGMLEFAKMQLIAEYQGWETRDDA